MRLQRLKLVGQYKSITGTTDKPFIYEFKSPSDDYSPLCLVGLNGSGKSNFIELIADIFGFTDRYSNPQYELKADLPYEFTIDYSLHQDNDDREITLAWNGAFLHISILNGLQSAELSNIHRDYLPKNIIAYSSGHNQGLSSVFAKTQFQFYEVMRKQRTFYREYRKRYDLLSGANNENDDRVISELNNYVNKALKNNPALFEDTPHNNIDLDEPLQLSKPLLPIGMFTDYSYSQLVFIFLMVSHNSKFQGFLSDQLNITSLCNFQLDLRLSSYRDFDVVENIANRLEQLSLASLEATNERSTNSYNSATLNGLLNFEINDAFFNNLETLYLDLTVFFEHLMILNTLSANKWSNDEVRSLKTSDYQRNVPNVSGGLAPMRILNTKIELKNPNVHTLYDRLSDGEHQLIQVIGSLMMFEKEQSLFILDEPESHFNPEWRKEFVELVGEYVNLENMDLMISTHSPFMLSACKSERVLSFNKDKSGNIEIAPLNETETYGASFDTLLTSVFDLDVLISKKPLTEIQDILNAYKDSQVSEAETLQKLESFGDSFELNYQRNLLKNKLAKQSKDEE